jgi:hypothetical protein
MSRHSDDMWSYLLDDMREIYIGEVKIQFVENV